MAKSRTEKVKRNAFWEAMFNVTMAAFPFFVRHFITVYLGDSYLGLNSLCSSVLEVLSVANLGIDTALLFYLYKPAEEGDFDRINLLLKFYRKVYSLIGLVIFAAGLIIMPFLGLMIKGDRPEGINIYIIFFMYLLNNLISYLFIITSQLLLKAYQDNYIWCIVNNVGFIIYYSAQLVFIVLRQYYLYTLMLPVSTVLMAAALHMITKRVYPNVTGKSEVRVDKEFKESVFKQVIAVAIYRVRDITRNSFDSIIVSAMMGLDALAKYQNYYLVFRVPVLVRYVFTTSVTPSLGNYNVTEGKDKVYYLYKKIMFIQLTISGFFAVIFYMMIQDFMTLWMGADHLLTNITAVLFSLYLYVLGIGDVFTMMRSTTSNWKRGKKVALIEIISNIVLNVGLAYFMGMPGIVLATIISICFVYLPAEACICMKDIFDTGVRETFLIIVKNLVWVVVSFALAYWIQGLFLSAGLVNGIILKLVIECLIGIIVPGIILVVFYYKSGEIKDIVSLIRK